ncbi:hypothetical protein [Dietzia sp. Die43]|uniref:hypothetical protein n=1 Tax=Dietzia sp. Die43 TaxID=2926011 RepID=UPI0021194B61|nr:hypothetical protein [Dietzia sp. Die43]
MAVTTFIFADYDDPDLPAMTAVPGSVHFPLSLLHDAYSIHATPVGWSISCDQGRVTDSDLRDCSAVVYRRWRSSPPAPMVRADAETDASVRAFIERQWNSTIVGLLSLAYDSDPAKWSRDPMAVDNKLRTLWQIRDLVPTIETVIGTSTPLLDTAEVAEDRIWKPIDADQSVAGGRATTVIAPPLHADLREPCPAFYQRRIQSVAEIRVGYSFGTVASVWQEPIDAPESVVDLRYVDMARKPYPHPLIEQQAHEIARVLHHEVYTADILVDDSGQMWWADINPDGLFSGADSAEGALSACLTTGISLRLSLLPACKENCDAN